MTFFKKLCALPVLLACTTTLSAQNGIRFEQHMEEVLKGYEGDKGLTQEQKNEIERRIKEQVEAQRRKKQEDKAETQKLVSDYESSGAKSNTNSRKNKEAELRQQAATAAEKQYETRNDPKYEQRDREFESRRNMSGDNQWAADVRGMQRGMNNAQSYTPAKAVPARKQEQTIIKGRDILQKANQEVKQETKEKTLDEYLEIFARDHGESFTDEDFEKFNAMLRKKLGK